MNPDPSLRPPFISQPSIAQPALTPTTLTTSLSHKDFCKRFYAQVLDIFTTAATLYFPHTSTKKTKQLLHFYISSSNSTNTLLIYTLAYYLKYLYLTQTSPAHSPILTLTRHFLSNTPHHTIPDLQQGQVLVCHKRIFIAALIAAHKFNREPAPSNKAWTGLSKEIGAEEMAEVERVFLNGLEWNLRIQVDDYYMLSKAISYWNL